MMLITGYVSTRIGGRAPLLIRATILYIRGDTLGRFRRSQPIPRTDIEVAEGEGSV
jgi:hypothetical protein